MDNLNLLTTDAEDELNQSFRINDIDIINNETKERQHDESPTVNLFSIRT